MAITFQLPQDLEQSLRGQVPDLDEEAREAFLVALYRQGKLSHPKLAALLDLDRMETDEILQKHGVTEDLGTIDDYLADVRTLEKLRSNHRR